MNTQNKVNKLMGFDLIDFNELAWNAHQRESANKNNFSYWYPRIANKNSKFKTPKSVIIQFTKYERELINKYYEGGNEHNDEIKRMFEYKFTQELDQLKDSKTLFIKNGTFSNKFDFGMCTTENKQDRSQLIENFLDINYTAQLYGASGSTEMIVREFIESNDEETIYGGMPLRTEFRLFYDFDTHQVMDIVNYWDVDYMLDNGNFRNDDDETTLSKSKDRINFQYQANKDTIIQHMKDNVDKKCDLDGQWSVDFMMKGDDIYLIDMAIATNSTYFTGENHDF